MIPTRVVKTQDEVGHFVVPGNNDVLEDEGLPRHRSQSERAVSDQVG